MEVKELVEQLLKIKTAYPNLTNDEVLKLLELKTLIEIKGKIKPNGR